MSGLRFMLDELNQCVFVLQTGHNIAMHLWISMNGSSKKPTLKRIADVINCMVVYISEKEWQRQGHRWERKSERGSERLKSWAEDYLDQSTSPCNISLIWLNTLTKSKPPFLKIIPALIVIIFTQSLNYPNKLKKSLKYNSMTA